MEIRTGKSRRRDDYAAPADPRDRGAYLRRKSSQRLRKRQLAGRRLMAFIKLAVKLGSAAALIGAAAAVYWHLSTSTRFDVGKVTCEGCVQVQPEEIESIIRRDFPRNILQIDLVQLQKRLEKEKWIRAVEIRRVLPSELIIYVVERRPAVVAELNGELVLMDREGILLDRYGQQYGRLDVPVFMGLLGESSEDYQNFQEENSSRVATGLSILAELEEGSSDYPRRISEIDLSDPDNIRLIMVGDTTEVLLGDRDFLKRFQTFMANMPQYEELKAEYTDIAAVDLRFDGKIIYRPRNLPAAPAKELAQPPQAVRP